MLIGTVLFVENRFYPLVLCSLCGPCPCRYEAAEPLVRSALDVRRAVLGVEHPATANSLNNLGGLLMGQGKTEEAAQAFRDSLTITEKVRLLFPFPQLSPLTFAPG